LASGVSLILRVPVRLPVADGVKTILTVQVAPPWMVAPFVQEFVPIVKSPVALG